MDDVLLRCNITGRVPPTVVQGQTGPPTTRPLIPVPTFSAALPSMSSCHPKNDRSRQGLPTLGWLVTSPHGIVVHRVFTGHQSHVLAQAFWSQMVNGGCYTPNKKVYILCITLWYTNVAMENGHRPVVYLSKNGKVPMFHSYVGLPKGNHQQSIIRA